MKKIRFMIPVILLLILSLALSAAATEPEDTAPTSLSVKNISLLVGKTQKIKLKNAPGKVTWSSSDESVASIVGIISKSGNHIKIKGNASGIAKIKAFVNGKTYTCKVRVRTKNEVFKGYQWADRIYLTGDAQTDYMIELVCQKAIGKPGKSQKQMIRDLFKYLACFSTHYSSNKTNNHVQVGRINYALTSSKTRLKIDDYKKQTQKMISRKKAKIDKNFYWPTASFMLTSGAGDCYTTAYTLQALLGHIGIRSLVIGGRSSTSGHGWNAVKFHGKYYFCDADSGNYWWYTIGSGYTGPFDYSQCMFGVNRLNQIGYTYMSDTPALAKYSLTSLSY